ncbi:MAG TPA: hypothetical protein VF789_34715 [Thermoanaerobaculia bacterium]
MRRILCFALAALGSLTIASAAHATACATWSCNETTRVCDFDMSCSSVPSGSSFSHYVLNYGDGTSTGNTTDPTHTKTYSQNSANITVEVHSGFGSFVLLQTIKCYITVRNVVGPPLPSSGTCTTEP